MRVFYLIALCFFVGCGGGVATNSSSSIATTKTEQKTIEAPNFKSVKVVRKFPHNPSSYTQGLLFADGKMYESTGQYGDSKLMVVDINSGKVEKEVALSGDFFGEGLALLAGKLYQLTWMEGKCFVYDANSLRKLETLSYSGEGWGLVAYGDELLMSDGTSQIKVIDPTTFRVKRSFDVEDNRGKVRYLNELEIIDGKLYANIYCSDLIAVIDIQSGRVLEYLDCTKLVHQIGNKPSADVINGIAYDSLSQKLYLTGKLWDTLFEVEF
ncbi:MAG: glutaminyl-peptide cyclotransferase [Rikenellaceae bacterium]